MTKFKLPGDEVTGTYSDGEEWRIKANKDTGVVETKDERIAATLAALAADPTHPIEAVKGK